MSQDEYEGEAAKRLPSSSEEQPSVSYLPNDKDLTEPPAQCQQQPSTCSSVTPRDIKKNWTDLLRWLNTRHLNIIFTGMLVITTFLQYCVSQTANQIGIEANRVSEESSKVSAKVLELTEWDQRPWVGVTRMCLTPLNGAKYGECIPKPPDVFRHVVSKDWLRTWIVVNNTGRSPALKTKVEARWCVTPNQDREPPTFEKCTDGEKRTKGPRVLFPQGDSTLDVTIDFKLSQENIDAIVAGNKKFYLIGRITYDRDLSAQGLPRYITEFCLFYDPHERGETHSYYYCEGGNNAQ